MLLVLSEALADQYLAYSDKPARAFPCPWPGRVSSGHARCKMFLMSVISYSTRMQGALGHHHVVDDGMEICGLVS